MNPFQEWLELDCDRPNHYQLLGLADFESDLRTIATAADRAMSKVRSYRPGEHAQLWAKLLDRLAAAKSCLTDPQEKAEYDRRLRAGEVVPDPHRENASPSVAFDRHRYPPATFAATRSSHPTDSTETPPVARAVPFEPVVDEQPSVAATELPASQGPVPGVPYLQPVEVGPPPAVDPMAPVDPIMPVPSNHSTVPQVPPEPQVLGADERSEDGSGNGVLLPLLVGVTLGLLSLVAFVVVQYMGQGQQRGPVQGTVDEARPLEPRPESGGVEESGRAPGQPRPQQATSARPPKLAEALGGGFGGSQVHQPPAGPAAETPVPLPVASGSVGLRDPVPELPTLQPTRDELMALGKALTAARRALSSREFDAATKHFETAQALARQSEHRAMVDRLRSLGEHVKEFYAAVDRALDKLQAGSELRISESTIVSVVEIQEGVLTLHVAGMNRRYLLDDLAPGLAMALAADGLGDDDLRLPLLKGAYLAVHERTTAGQLDSVRTWWNQASISYPAAEELLGALDDDYELVEVSDRVSE